MNDIYIHETSILSPFSNNIKELIDVPHDISCVKKKVDLTIKNDFKLRKSSHYVKLGINCVDDLLKNKCYEDIGTVFTTGYGNVEYSKLITDIALNNKNSFYNVMIAVNCEPNSCLGQTCINYKLTGISTCMTTGNILEYLDIMLEDKQAKNIIICAIEEYSDLYDKSICNIDIMKNVNVVEGASAMLISKEKENSIARITKHKSTFLGECPYFKWLDKSLVVPNLIKLYKNFNKPELILTSMNGSYFDYFENECLKMVFDNVPIKSYKKYLGESLGNANIQNMVLATGLLNKYKSILSLGLDLHGNYFATMIEDND